MIAVECCKQKYFQGVLKAKGLSESITTVREYNNKRIAREYLSPKYCREVPQTKVIPVNVTIKRNSRSNIIKTTAREGQIQNDDRECNNQKNCHKVSQSEELPGRMTNQSSMKEHRNQNGLPETTKFEMTASEYHIKYHQIMNAGEGHFQKNCMGVSQLKEMPESITIKRSARENHN